MKLTGRQIEAAMALAGITRETMCKDAKIAKKTLSDILNDKTVYREETIRKITDILEVQGIEFLPGEGVKKKDRIIAVHEGDNANKILVEDFYNTLRDTGGEILIAHLIEGDASKELGAEFLKEQIQKRKAANITHRVFVRENDPNLIPPFDTYHVLPDEYFAAFPFYVYGSKLALFSRQPNPKAIIINDERFAESVRKLFNFVWDRTVPPKTKKEE